MLFRHFLIEALIAVAILAQDGPPPEFQKAYRLAAENKYDEALKILDEELEKGTNTRNALFAIGEFARQAGQYQRGAQALQQLQALEPKSGRVRNALLLCHQALQAFPERDADRAELIRLRTSGDDPELKQQSYFIRDEFKVAGRTITTAEFFELTGDRAVRYAFDISKPASREFDYRVSLGSYNSTNAFWRAMTKPTPPKDARLFHLDGYYPSQHSTFAMLYPEPTYDEVKKIVTSIVDGTFKPQSSSVVKDKK